MVEEARFEETESGFEPVSEGWFVVNVADTAWRGATCSAPPAPST
jgi:hypothetical protein